MSSLDDTGPSSGDGSSAADIITYIGVPLAVLGVMPILYNTGRTLITLSNVKRLLRKSRLAGITRGDVVNHVIEVELPRFSIAPVHREHQADEYWHIYEHPSLVPGGSWTIFNWKMHTVGIRTQRIEYSDQLRQPQAEIGFEVLSPDRDASVLSIAPLDDSDGNLSLAVKWSRKWKVRDKTALPPYWIRIMGPSDFPVTQSHMVDESTTEIPEGVSGSLSEPPETNTNHAAEAEIVPVEPDLNANSPRSGSTCSRPISLSCSTKTGLTAVDDKFIRCHISIEGLIDAMTEDSVRGPLEHIEITHLEIRKSNSNTTGVWFASVATALGTASHGTLWNYHIPEELLSFARKDTVPCGILVMLNIIEESETPEWATKYNDADEIRDVQFKMMREEARAVQMENRLPPDQKMAAIRERQRKKGEDWIEQMRANQRKEAQRAEQRMTEALQSLRWDSKLVADHNLKWLKHKGLLPESYDVRRAVEVLLYRMLGEPDLAADLTYMLDLWKGWVDGGGIKRADFLMVKDHQESFAWTSLILSVLRSSVTAADGSVAMDLQESVRIWKRVRLG